jgi:hypothetical protein
VTLPVGVAVPMSPARRTTPAMCRFLAKSGVQEEPARKLAAFAPVLRPNQSIWLIALLAFAVPRGDALHFAKQARLIDRALAAATVVAFGFPICVRADFCDCFTCHTVTSSFQRGFAPLFFFCWRPGLHAPKPAPNFKVRL